MINERIYFPLALVLLFPLVLQAQIVTKSGSIYGRVTDIHKTALPGVGVTLESNVIPTQFATTGASGSFRFINLPPGIYSAKCNLSGFTEVKQEGIRVSTGITVDLEIILKESLTEQIVVSGKTSLLDSRKVSNDSTYTREYLDHVPSGRDPWALLNMTAGVDSDRFNTGSETGRRARFFARGGEFRDNVWRYDGVDNTGVSPGLSTLSYDFDAFEEVQITTGGNDASIQTGGVSVNLVTRRGGNKWEGDASYYLVNEDLQSSNTPDELEDNPLFNPDTGEAAAGSNRISKISEAGLNVGGPLLKDKLFIWSGYRRSDSDLYNILDQREDGILTQYNLKLNTTWNSANDSQVGYFKGLRQRHFAFIPAIQAPETFWSQDNPPLQGIWTAQHTWIPNDHFLLTARYGYVGDGVTFIPDGGSDKPMIFLAAIPRFENTLWDLRVNQPAHDFNVEADYFKEDLLGGDHEFKFGFEYKATDLNTFSSYGNGVFILDYYQTVPRGPLTSGYVYAYHYLDSRNNIGRVSFHFADTFRKNRLTLNIGLRFDHQTGSNDPSNIPAVPGFEEFVGPFAYEGSDPGIAFNNVSPRIGATLDITGDGKTILRGNFARYYDTFHPFIVQHINPTAIYNGAFFAYENRNGDRIISPDEITSDPNYFGGLTAGGFDLNAFLATRKYDPDLSNSWTNEIIMGIERELRPNLSISGTYTFRKYGDLLALNPFGVTSADYIPAGTYDVSTSLGDFSVPYFTLGFKHDGTALLTSIKDYTQTYHGLDLVVRKRMSHNFLVNGSLTVQRQTGHYNGGDSLAAQIDSSFGGTTFAFDPTNLPFLDGKPYAYRGGPVKQAVYPYSEWNLKISGVYQLPWNFTAGAFLRYQQGYPFVLFGSVSDNTLSAFYGTSSHQFLLEPLGSRRFDNVFTIDVKVEKAFQMSDYGRLTAIVDVFNLTNENAILSRNDFLESGSFNQIQEVLSPRAVRLGVRYSY